MSDNLHKNHRQRLKKRFLMNEFESFEEHNILELLLFYSIPRKDTNNIAHRLIDTFGSISGVFDAGYEELLQVSGIGEQSATLIKMISTCTRVYYEDKQRRYKKYDSVTKLMKFFAPKFIGMDKELLYAAYFDNTNKLASCDKISEGTFDHTQINIEKIVKKSYAYKCKNIVIAHNHPTGIAVPSTSDQIATIELKKALNLLNINLVDHIIVGKNLDTMSMKEHGYMNEYTPRGNTVFAE